ncbi:glucokinase [Algoriphagus locisalis]|uniref:Glucokinase n=1 Tax=Algoriphagus locisalis TaxID=305507 RepID=A0A1I7BXQ1_9BACT|nr:ROK family protein [Algoriphagus locisalis]SFT91964.1 glucokinase [Algoriphagus locisalis]
MKLIGVDIGGSHISAAQVELKEGNAVFHHFHEADVNTFGEQNAIVSAWSKVILQAAGDSKDIQVGIAMPGPFNYEKGVSLIKDQGKMASLYQLSIKDLLVSSLGISSAQIEFTNDAEAFLKGESYAGAGKDFQNSIGLTLGTGLGSAIKVQEVVKDAKLWTAPFRDGIAEDYLGTSWFVKYAFGQFGIKISGVKDLLNKGFDSGVSKQIFATFGKTLGEFLFPYLIRLHSEGVVLGGKVSLASDHYLPTTQAYLERMGYPVIIKRSVLGEKSALIGACLSFV